MLTDGGALISLPAGMAVPGGSRSPRAMGWFILYLCLWMVLLLHCPASACPKPCACYVPTELHCTFRYITAIPRQMAANVERVNLGYNSLVEIAENDFSGLHKMELLMLHSNEIQRIHENAFNDLHALQVLKMSYNKVRSLHENTFHGLKSLIRLHMDHNKIEFMNPEALYGLNSLRLVHLEGNLLKQIHPDTFVTLRYMQIFKTSTVKHIYLSDNLFSSLPKDMFSYMPELETVYLNGNPWSCDCQLQWFAEWAEKSRDMIKCKRDRSYASGQQCPTCSTPSLYNGKELTEISTAELSCVKPSIDPSLKVRNITDSEEGDFTSISPQDFIAPIGSLILNMTDQAGNEANLACSVQRPSKMSPLTLDRSNGHTLLKTSLSTFLVCSIDYDHIQKLWGLLATYSDSPMRLRRDLLLTKMPHVSYSYKQISSEDDVFTNIEAELRAEPNWLMQDQVTFQLDRTATTLNTLHVRYIADAHIMLEQYDQKPLKYKWAMILKDNTTQTEHSAVTGGTVELDCQAIGEPTPVIEWILPDGSKVRAPYTSEEGRIIITKSGKFILRAVDTFDTGLYHCIGTNYHDADVLSFRIVVVNPDVEHESLNGAEISPFIGDTLYLPCDSSGIPRASVSWILPDHSVVHQSSKYRHIFSNGTLKMHELTDRDRGYFRCVAANSYGFDVLVVNVLTKAGKNRPSSKAISLEDDDQEASGKGEFTAVTEHYMPLTTAQTIISQTSLVTTEKQLAKIKQKKTETKIQYRKNGNKPSKRARGQRRQFNQSNRRIDPQRWADLLEKTKKKSVISPIQEKRANTEKPKANHFEKVSGDGEETSGDDFVQTEEGFIILTTKMPTETTTYQLTPSKATKTKMPTDTTTHPLTLNKVTETTSTAEATTPSIRTVKISPVATPKVIEIGRSELPNVNTEGKHLTTIPTTEITTALRQSVSSGERHIPSKILTTSSKIFNLKSSHFIPTTPTTSSFTNITPEYPTNTHSTKDSSSNVTSNNINTKISMLSKEFSETSTSMQPTASYTSRPFDFTAKELNTQNIFSSGEIVLNKLTSEAPNEDRTTSLTTSDSTIDTSQSLNTTSAKSSLEISFMTVTKPENEIGHIYFQSTQKIITPLLPHGSTIITHQQIQIIQDVTPKTTNTKQRYGRRKISGKRRIVRPDRIPNIRERYTFLRPERKDVTTESTTMTLATAHKHSTSPAPLIEPPPLPAAMTTTTLTPQLVPTTVYSTEETVTHSQDKQAFIDTENKGEKTTHIFAEMKQPKAEIIEGFGSTVASSPFSTKTNNFASTVVSTTAPHTSNSRNMSPTVPVQPSTVNIHSKSMPPTAKAKKSSKTLRGKIPWHRFFGNGQIQKEILKKLRKPKLQTFEAATTILPTKTLIGKGTEAVSELDTPDLTTVVQLIRNDTATSASITESTILEKELTFIPSSTFSSFMVPTSLQAHSSSQASPISNESNIKSYTTFSTMTATTTSDSNTSTEKTAFNNRVVNSTKKKGLKRKRLRKKNTTTENLTSMQWKTSSGTQMTESLPVTTHSYTSITPTMPFANEYLYESVKGSSLVITDLSKIPTTTFKFKTKVQTKPPTSQTSVTIDTNKMTVPNNSPSIITIMEPISTTHINMKKSINQTPLPPESAQTTSTRAAEKAQKKHVDTSANTKYQPKQPKKSNKYQSTTESKRTFIAELITSTPTYPVTTYALYTNMLHPTDVALVTSATPQITNVSKSSSLSWKEILWNKPVLEMTQRSKTVIFNTLTILKPESLTGDTPVVQKDKYPKKKWSQKATNQETTTTNLVTLETLTSERPTKPKIKGGKLASFTVLANSDAFIPCEAMGLPVPTIHWTKVSSGTYLLKSRRGNKLEVFGNGTLSIPNVSIQDRGQYLCVAANKYGSDRLLVTLSVVAYPPRIIDGRSKEITVHAGNSVEVKCQAEGSPIPDIEWILANKSSVSEFVSESHRVTVKPDGSLVIKDVTIYDRGIYKCLANNPAGSDTLSVKIQVIAAPPIILESKREQVEGILGENLKLPCTARGNPKPSVYWVLSDGTQVKPLHFINVKLFMFSNGTLYIRNVDSSDSGKYECIATSSTGSERRVITLTVEQRDTTPKIITASPKFTEKNFGDQLLLNCSADGEPKPKIIWRLPSKAVVDQWHRMGSRIQVYPNGSLYIEAVNEKDAGDYLCVARNKIGDDLILMRVSITLKAAKIDQKQYFKKQVPYGKDFKVDCKASGSPIPEISWSLPDGTMINNVLQADDNGRSRFRRYVLFENGTLFLNKVGITEEGDYTCVAQNTLGKDEMKVHITVVTAAPRIKQNYKTFASVKAGETATFDCEAIGEPRPRTFWLLPSGDMISASSDRYLLHVNGSLSITKVKLLDAGEHMCVARNPAGEDTKLYKLEVVSRPPLINGLYINKTVIKDTAVKHSRKLIDCRAEGTPIPHVMWIMPDNIFLNAPYYGSRIIVHKNGTLEIRNVRASDTAEFICVARNDGGETVLVVQLEATDMLRRPMFRNPFNEKITARPDRTAILNCSADGNPAPEMIWLLPNGTRFSPGQTLSRYHLGSDGTFFIHYPTKEDTGKYRCAAKNQVGYIEKLIILEVGQKPNILTHPKRTIKVVSGEQLSLHCLSDGVPKPNIMWTVPSGFILDRPQINGRYTLHENGTLAVRETSIHDRGNYICRAHNNAGDMAITVPVMIIAYAPRITNRPPQSIRTKAGMPVQLSCIAIGIPKPEISWELPDHSVLSTASKGRPSGSELLHPQGTLVIQHPKRSDSGTYRCTATNSLGNDMSATFIQVI